MLAPIICTNNKLFPGRSRGHPRGRMGKIAEALFPNALCQRKIKELCKLHQVIYRIYVTPYKNVGSNSLGGN